VVREPSRFLNELPEEYTELHYSEHKESLAEPVEPEVMSRAKPSGNGEYKAGTRVSHSHFGTGVVESVSGNGESARLTIQFDSLPTPKVLVVKYAKLRVLK
jgi:DNA helicase-2/ATP-dependent DNA helicase PcrA